MVGWRKLNRGARIERDSSTVTGDTRHASGTVELEKSEVEIDWCYDVQGEF
jgi:hypothetical protein